MRLQGLPALSIWHVLLASLVMPVALALMTGSTGVSVEAAQGLAGPEPQPSALMDMSSQMDPSHTFFSSFSVSGF